MDKESLTRDDTAAIQCESVLLLGYNGGRNSRDDDENGEVVLFGYLNEEVLSSNVVRK